MSERSLRPRPPHPEPIAPLPKKPKRKHKISSQNATSSNTSIDPADHPSPFAQSSQSSPPMVISNACKSTPFPSPLSSLLSESSTVGDQILAQDQAPENLQNTASEAVTNQDKMDQDDKEMDQCKADVADDALQKFLEAETAVKIASNTPGT